MPSNAELKEQVKQAYGERADQAGGCCCSSQSSDSGNCETLAEDYSQMNGYVEDADLSLGCGIPTNHIDLKPGTTVLDLGSGAGNDVFVARSIIGDSGTVIGVDMTEKMINLAERNQAKLGFQNVEFRLGDIEDLPVETTSVDTVLSNCVLNLVPDKQAAFREIYRVLKPGGTFCVSDIVTRGQLSPRFMEMVELYTGCIAGAVQLEEYLEIIKTAGFPEPEVKEKRSVPIPEDLLEKYRDDPEVQKFLKSDAEVLSVTVTGTKPIMR
ncbi:MAG: arsenite methyltransferase [Candidatus Marinimicrobia bacterium]|nr:arsenite methyltransferase [Candidatus Neomarinimicrobiota bacterium]MCF7828112.1 arsenite methyltransferase [Candidatus Neomarinimicrobiota bacterium]MCF7879713.1 arsenite methyltransferase [Candidatus Neomarinimicrobiota bacterium]